MSSARSHLVRSSAAEALGSVGDVRAVKVLREALADRSALVRGAAALSLGLLGRGPVELRRQLETERRAHVRLCIQVALVDLGERVYLDGVLLFLGHRDYRVRCATANLLAGLGRGALHPSDHPRIIEAMKRRLRIERTVAARSSIRSALAELRR